jgi:hypothetical protein
MTVSMIPDTDLLPPVVPSADPAYDYEASARSNIKFRFGLGPAGLRVGVVLPSGERFGYLFGGFVPTARTLVGSAAAFRMGGRTLTFRVVNGKVKERIRFETALDAVARLSIGLTTAGCHFEQAPLGGLVVWSDLTKTVIATIEPPTIADAKGRSDCAIRYELALDGKSVDLVIDPAWLAAATYPVFIDPTTVVTSTNAASLSPTAGGHIFKMSDAKLVAVWSDGINIKRSTSTDAGATWSSASTIFSDADANSLLAACVNGDTIYGAYTRVGTDQGVFKMVYAAGAFTDTGGGFVCIPGIDAGTVPSAIDARWDAIKGNMHVGIAFQSTALPYTQVLAISTVPGTLARSTAVQSTAGSKSVALAVDGAATPNVYLAETDGNGVGTMRLFPFTWNGVAYGGGTVETPVAEGNTVALALDQSSLVDIVWQNAGALKTVKRTGVNTYGSVTTLISTGVFTSAFNRSHGISRTGNANADIFVVFKRITDQANGEIYQIKRRAGSWQAATRVAGGDSTGWGSPTAIDLIQADGKAHMLYLTGTGTLALVYDGSLVTGTAPSAPTNVLPTGNGNTSLTPTISAKYVNADGADALGSYQILVVRQSDVVTMWDTGKTAYTGSAITNGGTFTKVYAGTGLAKAITYTLQVKFWDANGDLAGVYNTAVTFQVNDAPSVAITSSAAPATSGPTIVWTYSQALGHAQASYRILIKDSTDTTVVYDSGTVASAALSAAVPSGTLATGVTYKLHLTVLSVDGL